MNKTKKKTRISKQRNNPNPVDVQNAGFGTTLPAMRQMTVIAQDPSLLTKGKKQILMAGISIPAEDLAAGPTGYRVQIVDYDATTRKFKGAHSLPSCAEDEPFSWRKGHKKIVKDYRFHAQNVYALVMKTLSRFEFALGRRIGWSFKTHQLKVAPHGMLDANAFYTPMEQGLVFGYFTGRRGKSVYTCLSHDIVVHETTHALIDALREKYMNPSSPDQGAFHEGFSDVIALLSVFTQRELVQQLLCPADSSPASTKLLKRTRVSVTALKKSALFGLAEQMGDELNLVRGEALRQSTLLKPSRTILDQPEFKEPHRRGEVLVAAVLNAFIRVWAQRIKDTGIPGQKLFPMAKVAEEGADIADALATMWIRALDYMPPVHVEFPDALSAALTADTEVRPDDSRFNLRKHILESFHSFGIEPAAKSAQGIWDAAPKGLHFERVRFESMRIDKDEIFRFIWDNRKRLGLRDGAYSEVLSVRPCVRIGNDGFVLHETVAEYYQVARLTPAELAQRNIKAPEDYLDELQRQQKSAANDNEEEDEEKGTTPLYGGGILVFDEYGRLKYHIYNDVFGKRRQKKRLKYLWESGMLVAKKDEAELKPARLSTIHRLRAIDAMRFPAEGW